MPIIEDVKNIIDEYIVDISPCTHSNEDLVSLPLSYCITDESFKDDRFQDIFTIEYDFHAYDEVWLSHDDHDINSDY